MPGSRSLTVHRETSGGDWVSARWADIKDKKPGRYKMTTRFTDGWHEVDFVEVDEVITEQQLERWMRLGDQYDDAYVSRVLRGLSLWATERELKIHNLLTELFEYRQAMPALIAEVRRLKAENDRLLQPPSV